MKYPANTTNGGIRTRNFEICSIVQFHIYPGSTLRGSSTGFYPLDVLHNTDNDDDDDNDNDFVDIEALSRNWQTHGSKMGIAASGFTCPDANLLRDLEKQAIRSNNIPIRKGSATKRDICGSR